MDILRIDLNFETVRRAAAAIALIGATSVIAIDAAIPLPRVTGPLPNRPQSYPFGGAAHTRVPADLALRAYVEEEYLISGSANVYDWPKAGPAVVRTASAPYTTRVLVRRPTARARFSGTAIIELLNPSSAFDLNTGWAIHHDHLMRSGDAWIGVTAKPVAIRSLKAFDPERYGSLSWANPIPATDRRNCAVVPRDSERATENGLVWDIYRQVGTWLRSGEKSNPLAYGQPRTAVQSLVAWGYSQTGGFLYTYAHAIHPLDVQDRSSPLFDGYLIAAANGPVPIHQCAPSIPPDDPRRQLKDVGVPVIRVMTQSEYLPNIAARLADSDKPPNLTRNYEIPGAAQATPDELNFSAAPEDILKAQRTVPPMDCMEGPRSRFPSSVPFNAILQNLKEWIIKRVPPPPGRSITVGNGKPFLDKFGNLESGVRTPYVDVPTSVWHANATGESSCRMAGYEVRFAPERLKTLYRSKDDYVDIVQANVTELVKYRYMTKEDGERLVEEAKKLTWP